MQTMLFKIRRRGG